MYNDFYLKFLAKLMGRAFGTFRFLTESEGVTFYS